MPTYTDRDRAEELAEKVNSIIPHHIEINFWMLPILETLVDRIEALEAEVNRLKGGK